MLFADSVTGWVVTAMVYIGGFVFVCVGIAIKYSEERLTKAFNEKYEALEARLKRVESFIAVVDVPSVSGDPSNGGAKMVGAIGGLAKLSQIDFE